MPKLPYLLEKRCVAAGAKSRVVGRDGGDCSSRFLNAGADALQECDRVQCGCGDQDYTVDSQCVSGCFTASCDWSRSYCIEQHANIASCPVFDAVVLKSARHTQRTEALTYIMGGTARCTYTSSRRRALINLAAPFQVAGSHDIQIHVEMKIFLFPQGFWPL